MKWLKRCRWIGAGLLVISCLLMTHLLSPFSFLEKNIQNTEPVVLQVSSGPLDFPENDYRFLFSKMGLPYKVLDTSMYSKEDVKAGIERAISAEGENQVILFACGESCEAALSIAASQSQVVGLVMLAPEIETKSILHDFGRTRPNIPVGIFGRKNDNTAALYEQLSGEDATLLPGQRHEGIISGSSYFSSGGDRYFRSWNFLTDQSIFYVYMPHFRQVQISITSFVSNFILTSWQIDDQISRMNILDLHGVKILSVTLMIAGILLFFSSFGKRNIHPDEEGRKPLPEMTQPSVYSLWRLRTVLFVVVLLLFSGGLICISIFFPARILIYLSSWPVCIYLAQILAGKKLIVFSINGQRMRLKEDMSMGFLLLLLIVFSFFLKRLQFFSISLLSGSNRLIFLISIFILLAVCKFVQLSLENHIDFLIYANNLRKPVISRGFQTAVFVIPFALTLVIGIFQNNVTFCVTVFILFCIFTLHLWLGKIFRKASLSLLIPTVASSLPYVILLFA